MKVLFIQVDVTELSQDEIDSLKSSAANTIESYPVVILSNRIAEVDEENGTITEIDEEGDRDETIH